MTRLRIFPLLLLAALLAACSGAAAAPPAETPAPDEPLALPAATLPPPAVTVEEAQSPAAWPNGQTVTDEAGQVTVQATPLNLGQPDPSLDFEVALDTHSVALDMDLAQLATLSTADGRSVAASAWDGGAGGHHLAGVLSFPAAVDGAALLDGAGELTLTLRDVGAPERRFTWVLPE